MSVLSKVIGGCLVLASVPAMAAEPLPTAPSTSPYRPGFFYMSVGGFGQVQQRPSFTYGGALISPLGAGGAGLKLIQSTLSADVAGGGPAATLGYTFSRGALSRIGRRMRLEFGFTYFRGSGSDSAEIDMPFGTAALRGRLLNGTSGSFILRGIFFPNTAQYVAANSLRVNVDQYDNGLRLRTDFELGKRFTVTPSIGIVGGADSARYRYSFREEIGSGGPPAPLVHSGEVKETITSYYFGGEAGLNMSFQATRKLAFHGGATISIFRRNATLTGEDCASWSSLFPSCPATRATSTVRSTGSKTGYAVGLALGATYDLGWMKVSMNGFGRYDNAVPGIENPEFGGESNDPVTPARVKFFGDWSYGGMLMLSFPLG